MSTPTTNARVRILLVWLAAAVASGCSAPEDDELEGRLQRVVMDHPERGESRTLLMLEVAPGDERELVLADPGTAVLPTGALVRARGHALPPLPWNTTPRFAVRSYEVWSPAAGAAARAVIIDPARAPAKRKMAVVLLNFMNDDRQPLTPEEFRKRIFTNPSSTRAFHREQSYGFVDLMGKTSPDGDVFGWYTIPAFNRPCNHGAWGEAALAAAAAQGVDTSGYDHYVFFFPLTDACYYSGIGQQPGRNVWMNGLSIATMNHELGHNLGTPHAASRACTGPDGARVPLSGTCRDSEYGNPFDVMGGGVRHTNAVNKAQARWLSGGNVQYVTSDGTYTLLPQERPSNGVQLLTTVRDETTHYYIEYRQPFGFDDFAADSPPVNGVIVLVGATLRTLNRSYLLDMNPATTTFGDAPLAVGKTFEDPGGEVKITLVEITPEAARVKFEFRGGSNMSVPDGGRQDSAPDRVPDRTPDSVADAGPRDAAPATPDRTPEDVGAPPPRDAAPDTTPVTPPAEPTGCSCDLSPRPSSTSLPLVFIAAVFLALRLKRSVRPSPLPLPAHTRGEGEHSPRLRGPSPLPLPAHTRGEGEHSRWTRTSRAGRSVRPRPRSGRGRGEGLFAMILLNLVACGSPSTPARPRDATPPPPPPTDAAPPPDAAAPAADRPPVDGGDGDVVNTEDDGGSSGRIFLYPVPAPVKEVCAQYAATYCARLGECTPRRLAIDHGSQELCRARRDQACRIDFLAPSRAERPEDRAACNMALATQSCRDFYFARRLPACDAPPGMLAVGAVCFRTSQCAAGLACRIETDETCGTCQKALAIGGDCSTWGGGCPVGTGCYGDECLARRRLGEPCKMTSAPCELGLECTTRGCVEKEALAGAACAREDVCDPMKDLYCNLKTAMCDPLPAPVAAGGKCGNTTAEGAFLRCGDDAVCFGPSEDPLNRTCVARAPLGQRCDSVTGVSCLAPGACSQRSCVVPVVIEGGRYLPTACPR